MDETTTLLLAAASGDRGALASFVRRTQDDVWRFCAHLVDPASADDLTQEVYLRVLQAAPRYRGDASARTWLLRIARNVAADEIRGRQRRRRSPVADVPPTAAAVTSDRADELAMHELLRSLDPDRRTAFVLTQVIGLTYEEAAVAAGTRVGTIRSRVARARAALIDLLEDGDGDGHDDAAVSRPPRSAPGRPRHVAPARRG